MKKKIKNIIIILLLLLSFGLITMGALWVHYTGKVSNNSELITFEIKGTGNEIGQILKTNNLIKNADFFKLYLKVKKINNLKAGTYQLSKNMDLKEIITILQKGNNYNADEITITFKEGLNMREIATIIADKTNNTYDEVLALVKDKNYLQELIDKYWFIEKDILNKELYYPLEGYLFPETYRFTNRNVSIKDIFAKLLSQMDLELTKHKDLIQDSKYNIHQILTLASIVEKEGKANDFPNISAVFHNRLGKNQRLESCATTFYGMGLDFNATGIANSQMLANNNPYNTYKVAKLPIGPIASPSRKAILAALKPNDNKYLYFLSDSQGKTYFFKTYSEHQKKQQQLIKEGKWNR